MPEPTIKNFVAALQAGVEQWEIAGRILVTLRNEDATVFRKITEAHSFITLDTLEVFYHIGQRTLYPLTVLLPKHVFRSLREMSYEQQVKLCATPINVVTRMVGDKPVIIRKPIAQLSQDDCRKTLWRKGNFSVDHQVKQLTNPKPITLQSFTPKPKSGAVQIPVRTPKSVGFFAVSRGPAGTWRFEKTNARPMSSQRVLLECGQAVIELTEYQRDQE
jgi:hypothetical protein